MKRRVIQRRVVVFLLLLLVAGAIVNVAVAWLIVERNTPRGPWRIVIGDLNKLHLPEFRELSQREIEWLNKRGWPRDDEAATEIRGLQATDSCSFGARRITYSQRDARPLAWGFFNRQLYGWPLPSLEEHCVVSLLSLEEHQQAYEEGKRLGRQSDEISRRGAITLGSSTLQSTGTIHLPYIPVHPGFAINTIFYAAILWVVSFVPGMVRRRIRRRRGLCPACAYPIGTSPVCTECGKSLV